MKVKIDRDTIEYIVKQLKYDEKRNPKKNGVHLSGLVIDAEPITMNETNKEPSEINWEKGLLNGECFDFELWDSENNSLSEIEEKMVEKLTDLVLPRHMTYFDWNLPFAQASIIVLRPFIKNLLSQKDTEWKEKIEKEYIKYVLCKSYGKKYDGEIPFWEYKEKAEARDMQSWS